MKQIRLLTVIAALIAAVLLYSGCSAEKPEYNKESDLPDGTSVLLLTDIKKDKSAKCLYIEAKAGIKTESGATEEISSDIFLFPLAAEDDFGAEAWEPGAAGLTSRTSYTSAETFESGWFSNAKKHGYTETAFDYDFSENGQIYYLYESQDLSGVHTSPE